MIELFSNSGAFREIQRERVLGGYNPTNWRFRELLKLNADVALGNVALNTTGVQDLFTACKNASSNERGVVLATSHLNNTDVSVIAGVAAQLADVQIPVASTNYDLWHQRLMYRVAGSDKFFPVGYHYEGDDKDTKLKRPDRFDSNIYNKRIEETVAKAKSSVIAAFNPADADSNYEGKLPNARKSGLLAPHFSLAAKQPIIPALMQVEGQEDNPELLNDNAFDLGWMIKKKGARIAFGEPIEPTESQTDQYREILGDLEGPLHRKAYLEQLRMLRSFGGQVLEAMHDAYRD